MIQVSLALQQALRGGYALRHGFLALYRADGTTYLWTGSGTIQWAGQSWLGTGALGSVGDIVDSKEAQAHELRLSLSGVDPVAIGMQDVQVRGRPMTLWARWYNERTGEWFSESAILFQGKMDTISTQEADGKVTMTVVCRSPLFNWDQAPNVYYTNEEQQFRYPGDTGFDRMQDMPDKTLAGWNIS